MRASLKTPPLTLPRRPRPHSYTTIDTTAVYSEPAADKFKEGFPAWLAGRVDAGVNPAAKWTSGLSAKSVDDVSRPGIYPLTRHEELAIREGLLVYFEYNMTGVTDERYGKMLREDASTFTSGASDQPPDPDGPDRSSTFGITMPLVARHASYSNDALRIEWFPPASKFGERDEPTIDLHYRDDVHRAKTKAHRRLDNAADVLEKAELPLKAPYLYPFFTDLLPVFLNTPAKLMEWLKSYVVKKGAAP